MFRSKPHFLISGKVETATEPLLGGGSVLGT